ncbi:MAG: cysteine desulfurase [Saprospiraceae bacterium]|nr:cysteine desulfurase [Saprospiraceae bacterium]
MRRIYFDNAATTPVDPEVIKVMHDALQNSWGNPSAIYSEGRNSRAAIERARKAVATAIGASIGEVFFTSGGTESNNMALKCAVRDLGVERIISSPLEHHCILHSLDFLKKYEQVEVEMVPLTQNGRVDQQALADLIKASDKKTLVSLMHSNNEMGNMIDLSAISVLCEEHGALFHSDTVQTVGYFPLDVSKTKMAFISGSAHKFYGPKGVGFVYINGDNMIKPFIDGGAQERNMRGGTENIYGILGMAHALEMAVKEMDERRAQIEKVRAHLIDRLKEAFTDLHFNTDLDGPNHYKVLNVTFPESDKSEMLLFNLDISGISVSGGSACSSGADQGSHVINALPNTVEGKAVRFSFSHHNTLEEVDVVVDKLRESLAVNKPVGS